jgi:hypothetical protein
MGEPTLLPSSYVGYTSDCFIYICCLMILIYTSLNPPPPDFLDFGGVSSTWSPLHYTGHKIDRAGSCVLGNLSGY